MPALANLLGLGRGDRILERTPPQFTLQATKRVFKGKPLVQMMEVVAFFGQSLPESFAPFGQEALDACPDLQPPLAFPPDPRLRPGRPSLP